MSDSSKFVNAYIENSMGMIHDQVSLILQLKTQVKVTEDLLAEKDQLIISLQNDIEAARTEAADNKTDLSSLNEKTNEIVYLKGQLEHMNTFANQVNEMKRMLKEKEKELDKIKAKSDKSKPVPKKEINRKDTNTVEKVEKPVIMEAIVEQAETDDF